MTVPRHHRFPWGRYLVLLAVIALLALFPVISVYAAYLVADANGCRLDEAGVYPCIVYGADVGGVLAVMALLGWLMLATVPMGGIALCLWSTALLIHLTIRYMREKREKPQS